VTRAAQSEEVATESEVVQDQTPPSNSNGTGPKEGGRIPEDRDWPEMRKSLLDFGLESIAPEEAQKLVKQNKAIIIDLSAKYYLSHIEPSVHVPLYKVVKAKDTLTSLGNFLSKVTLLDWDAVNRNFVNDAKEILGDEKRLMIVSCTGGGSLKNVIESKSNGGGASSDSDSGTKSRSLRAAYELVQAGYTNVAHLQGGITAWKAAGLPMEGKKFKQVKRGKFFKNV
jgi:rhodanese-related sulfurtransferase